ncbi:V-type proton ATPase 116 kDa subunit a1 [Drosophila mojavensis]|uniref:V-type proton ATPase subunit a n=1 Tax=Drosophila mojavensis TaxID=7230 RepID=B4KMQ7_DROMO|nr:V-type proton ATPase 116 kDa subunit a1 [Drosophila mojavensis]EDW08799.1 uncharacterized protein Dmoj_GI20149 [Drosophila mojavensis]
MGFFCSEKMDLCLLLLHVENAFDCLMELGHYGGMQFNNVFDEDHILNGLYTKGVVLCSDLLRIVDYLEAQLKHADIKEVYYADVDTNHRPRESNILQYDRKLRRVHEEATSVIEHVTTLERRYNYMIEKSFALSNANEFLEVKRNSKAELVYTESSIIHLLKDQSEGEGHSSQLNYILGSIHVEKFRAFELLIYRLYGRNVLVRHTESPTTSTNSTGQEKEMPHKYVVLLMTTAAAFRHKLLKICQAFHVVIFECPESPTQRMLMIEQLAKDISDLELVLGETRKAHKRLLTIIANDLYIMRINLRKSLRVYDLLNRLYPIGPLENKKHLQVECFTPKMLTDDVRRVLNNGIHATGDEEKYTAPLLIKRTRPLRHMPPTYFQLNKFTQGFQNLIDAYGIADYRELNPAPYTIITFPFLFAIMFGDMGHGILLTLFACLMIFEEKRIEQVNRTTVSENEIRNILYGGRYIILLMGIFSIYIGFIYNDIMSRPLNLFGSSWSCVYNETTVLGLTSQLTLDSNDPKFYTGHPYPIGVDPIWKISGEDAITTFNSLKMKLAIILGVSQMMFGLTLSAVNCIHLKHKADLFLVVIPLYIFMICLFCYLVFLIFFKWLMYGGLKQSPYNSACAPSVLITFIDMMLMKNTELEDKNCNQGMFPNERILEYALVFVAFAMVPVLLAGKPIYLTCRQRQLMKNRRKKQDTEELHRSSRNTIKEMRSSLRYTIDFEESDRRSVPKLNTLDDALEFDMSEIWIHSGIHTIESVLGSVSHTASYLRLWALSLAHSQLSDVLWNMVLEKGLKNKLPIYAGVPILTAAFFIWSILTVAILVMMEGLSAFLHTLRLHWVEFQSKFFNGAGEPFRTFYFPPSTIRS